MHSDAGTLAAVETDRLFCDVEELVGLRTPRTRTTP
jgi:hypothetical protein